jgi:UDP-N-acetylglucosamine transferase subunit ALG13
MTALLIAATGGHLAQLDRLSPRIPGVDDDSVWVTFDSPQSRSLLKDRNHLFVSYSGPRDLPTAIKNSSSAARIIRRVKPDLLVSTGSAIAVSFLPVGRLFGLPALYIESAARAHGPSLTGSILQRVPGIQLFTQYRSWAGGPWRYAGSVFDDYVPVVSRQRTEIRQVLVTLGTIRFGFRRLLEHLVRILPPEWNVVWQVGSTASDGLGIVTRSHMSGDELSSELSRADLVIAHAGIGSALGSLDAGNCPVLVPREKLHGEHIDDHQSQIARELDARGLAVHRPLADLTADHLMLAASRGVNRREAPRSLNLSPR